MNLAHNDIHLWLTTQRGLKTKAFLQQILSSYLDIPPTQIRFAKTLNGKPYLKDRRLRTLQFNVSHSHGAMVCVVSYGEALGVDIEYPARKNRLEEISQRFFHPQEIQQLQAFTDEAQRRELFFKLWTSKEAYIKAIGLTIGTASLDEVAFSYQNRQVHPLFNTPSTLHWHFHTLPWRDYLVTTALAHKAWHGIKPRLSLFEI